MYTHGFMAGVDVPAVLRGRSFSVCGRFQQLLAKYISMMMVKLTMSSSYQNFSAQHHGCDVAVLTTKP